MSTQSKEQIEEQKLVNLLREKVDKLNGSLAERKERDEKIENRLAELDAVNAKNVDTLAAAEKSNLELKTQVDFLEKLATRPTGKGEENREKKKILDAAHTYLVKGIKAVSTEGQKLLNDIQLEQKKIFQTGNDPELGYLAPPELRNELVMKITEISDMRSICRTSTTQRTEVERLTEDQKPVAEWVGQAKTIPEGEVSVGKLIIPIWKLAVKFNVSSEQLDDSILSVSDMLMRLTSEAFQKKEGESFVKGIGVNEPQGFNADIPANTVPILNSGSATEISADNFLTMQGVLKTGYNPLFVLNRQTLTTVRKFKGGDGHYLWVSGLAAGMPNTIDGLPYRSIIDMDGIAPNAFPVALGDFLRGYEIIDRMSLVAFRDDSKLPDNDIVRFVFRRRTGGAVILPEAILRLKVAA